MQRRSLEADALAKEIGVANADLASHRGIYIFYITTSFPIPTLPLQRPLVLSSKYSWQLYDKWSVFSKQKMGRPFLVKTNFRLAPGSGRRAVYVKNEQGNPLLKMCPGRRSFGGFNPAVCTHSTQTSARVHVWELYISSLEPNHHSSLEPNSNIFEAISA